MSQAAHAQTIPHAPQPSREQPIPAEFGYWDNINKPAMSRIRKLMKAILKIDPKMDESKVLEFARGYYDTDPLAEAVVAEVFDKQGMLKGLALVNQALDEGVDSLSNPPKTLVELIEQTEREPDWLDWDKVALGAKVFRRYGRQMYYYLGSITLEGYRESSVAKPLAFTGAYDGSSTYKRFLETCNFWFDVSQINGLKPGGQGRKTAVKVRLMHVLVRSRLMEHPKWDLEAWGKPISQSDSLVTLAAGSVGAGIGVKKMGWRFSKTDIEAMIHFWRYVGYLMGVQPRWYPENFEQAVQLSFTTLVKGVKKSGDDGVSLSRSYLKAFAPNAGDPTLQRIRDYLNYQTQVGLTRYFLTRATYNHYELPKNGLWQWLPLLQAPAYFTLDTIRKPIEPLDRWLDKKVQKSTRRWLDSQLGDAGAVYKPVEQFTR